MAVSKRLRFAILKRDKFTCQYCHATDTVLTIDHVVAVSLGGTDVPSNLVAACYDCNAGKSSSSMTEGDVEAIDEDAIRWQRAWFRARQEIASDRLAENQTREAARGDFRHIWNGWTVDGEPIPLPHDWQETVERFYVECLADYDDIESAVRIVMRAGDVAVPDKFNRFLGVMKSMIQEVEHRARQLVDGPDWTRPRVPEYSEFVMGALSAVVDRVV